MTLKRNTNLPLKLSLVKVALVSEDAFATEMTAFALCQIFGKAKGTIYRRWVTVMNLNLCIKRCSLKAQILS